MGCFLSLQACNGSEPAPSETVEPAETVETETPAQIPETDVETTPTEATETVRQADSHVHGDATLAIVLENTTLTIELDSPLYNLAGFEHAPETDEQKMILEDAETLLASPASLFLINTDAECKVDNDVVDVHLMDDEGEDHGEHSHDDHNEHEHDDHDEDAEDGDHDAHDDHKDVLLTYTFTCDRPEKLATIGIANLFAGFPNMSEMDVVYLGTSSQKSFTLSPEKDQVTLDE